MIKLGNDLIKKVMDWHGGMFSALYSLGSTAQAGKPVTEEMVNAALDEAIEISNKATTSSESQHYNQDQLDALDELITGLSGVIDAGDHDGDHFDESIKPLIKEDLEFMALGGVFNRKIGEKNFGISKIIDAGDALQVKKAVIDMFKSYDVVDSKMIHDLGERLGLEPDTIEEVVYSIMTSFWKGGKWAKNPNHPIDKGELEMGLEVEKEHSDCPFIREHIARDHLAEDSRYYSKLNAAGLAD